MSAFRQMIPPFCYGLSDEPTEAEIRDVLEQLECCMVAHAVTDVPQVFVLLWKNKLHESAFMMDARNLKLLRLVDTGHSYVWQQV